MRPSWRALAPAILAASLASHVAILPAMAADPVMKVETSAATVAKGATLTVRVTHDAGIATSGVQATVTFDKSKLQVTSVSRGSTWADAPVWVPGDLTKVASSANASGAVKSVAAAMFPPESVPAGKGEFLVIEFTAMGCGAVTLGLPAGSVDALMLDGRDPTYGAPLKITTVGASVTIDCAAGSAAPSPTSTARPTATPATATATPATPTDSAGGPPSVAPSAGMSASPASEAPTGAPTASASGGVEGETASPDAAITPGAPVAGDGGSPWIALVLAVAAIAVVGLSVLGRSMRRSSGQRG